MRQWGTMATILPTRHAGAFALGFVFVATMVIGSIVAAPCASAGEKATAKVIGGDGKDMGTIEFEETLAGVLITARLKGLPPGPHGFHVHDIGRCEPPFASSGKILNPLNAKHGLRHEEGPAMGDMPNLHVPAGGEVTAEVLNPFVTLAPDADGSLVRETGTSVIIRANADDHQSQPDGNSGAPIACGVIKKAQ
jgi:superoxide dismutase, Cu-Zn family